MTSQPAIDDRLARAIALREDGKDEEARTLLMELLEGRPDHPALNLQCAWTHDKLGMEADAATFYEKAIALGLEGDDLREALLGLGSTYRTLGRYDEALTTLTRGVAAFPDDRAMAVFRAMALYNENRAKEACETLLELLITTTSDKAISRYENAITEYAADLDRTWP